MSTLELLVQIKAAKGANAKQAILRTLTPRDREIFKLALDPAKVFFYQVHDEDLPAPAPFAGMSDDEVMLGLAGLCGRLSERKITGMAATMAVTEFFCELDKRQQTWCQRILNKDLNVGVEEKSYLKIWKGDFPFFEPQLCDKWTDEQCIGWTWQPKLDGFRGVTEKRFGQRVCLSRKGNLLNGTDHIVEELDAAMDADLYVFDGEIMARRWNDTASKLRTKGNKRSDAFYNIFDILTVQEWETRLSGAPRTAPLEERIARMDDFFTKNPQFKSVVKVESGVITPDFGVGDAMVHCAGLGYEGTVVKRPGSTYRFKRTNDWLKAKPKRNGDFRIVGAVPGDPGTWCENILGALIIERNGVQTRVGTGFDEQQRYDFWDMHAKKGDLVGRIASINYIGLTDDGCLLHASFKELRLDKTEPHWED